MKDIYELLNDIDMDDFEEAYASEFEKEKIKSSLKKELFIDKHKFNRKMKFGAIAVASILIIASCIFSNPAFASNIPILNKLLQNIYGNKNIDFIPYSDFIGQTIEKNDIELTFNNVVITDDSMFLDFTIKNNKNSINKGTFNNALMIPQKVKINDIDMPTNGRTSSELIDDHTVRILESIDIQSNEYKPEGNLNVEINIYEVFNLKDTFDFKFNYDKTTQDKKSIAKTYNSELDLDGKKITIGKAYASPLSCSINFTSDSPNNDNIGFIAMDNNNDILDFNKSSGSLTGNYINSILYICNKDMKQVKFIPYTRNSDTFMNDKKIHPIDLNNKESFIINATNDFGVIVKNIILDDDYLIVNYNNYILGKETSMFGTDFVNLFLKDDNSIVPFADYDECKNLYDKYSNNYCTTSIFKINNKKDLSLELNFNNSIIFFKDKSINLDLPQ